MGTTLVMHTIRIITHLEGKKNHNFYGLREKGKKGVGRREKREERKESREQRAERMENVILI